MEKKITEFDRRIGNKIRWLRLQRGLTQQQLADLVKLSPQQLHKYENGQNRIGASRLAQLARYLHAPIADFFDSSDLPPSKIPKQSGELMRYFHQLDPPRQRIVVMVARMLSDLQD